MSQLVERTSLDLRFQSFRLRGAATEARLLASIAERGVEQPLLGVDTADGRLLLDGFKRYRCAEKLGVEWVPYVPCGTETAAGIAHLMGAARPRSLSILEQARFVVELLTTHGHTAFDVAELLARSKAWVSARSSLWRELCPTVREILFRGTFPVYSYMVTLRSFMRMNGVAREDVTRFVQVLAGHPLSVREIELLAHGYFRGPSVLRQSMDEGRWRWTLEQMQIVTRESGECNTLERSILRELERLLKSLQSLGTHAQSPRLVTRTFRAQAHLLLASLFARRESFFSQMEELYDRCGQADGHLPTAPGGDGLAGDQSPATGESPDGAHHRQAAGKAGAQDTHG